MLISRFVNWYYFRNFSTENILKEKALFTNTDRGSDMIEAESLTIFVGMLSTPQLLLEFKDMMKLKTSAESAGCIKIHSVTLFGRYRL